MMDGTGKRYFRGAGDMNTVHNGGGSAPGDASVRADSRPSRAGDGNIAMARRVAEAVRAAGGRTFFVGGCVRDKLLGLEIKDVDIEVHGITVRALEAVLDSLGERTAMGASFGVMGLRHYDIDIAMPRRERATGRGHKDFEVFVDPFIGCERAAKRRDFTMNALMQDALTGEILDFFGGREDLRRGVIRHVDDASFAEDPLRVFRAAQFAARFDFAVAEETVALCAGMAVDALAPERVMGELEKALMKAARPSAFFGQLRRMGRMKPWFDELEALSEADLARTMAALDAAAGLRDDAREPLHFMLAALCLALDAPDAQRLLARLTREVRATRYALNMSERGRAAARALASDPGEAGWMALIDAAVCPEDLPLLARANGASPDSEAGMRNLLALYRERMDRPFAMGRDLMAAGAKPGPRVGEALDRAHALRLAGATKAEQLAAALAFLREDREGEAR